MRLLTVREVAAELNCSVTHVYNLISGGELDAQDISAEGKWASWRIAPDALKRFRDRNQARDSKEVVNGEGEELSTDASA